MTMQIYASTRTTSRALTMTLVAPTQAGVRASQSRPKTFCGGDGYHKNMHQCTIVAGIASYTGCDEGYRYSEIFLSFMTKRERLTIP